MHGSDYPAAPPGAKDQNYPEPPKGPLGPPPGERTPFMEWVIIVVAVFLVMAFFRGGC